MPYEVLARKWRPQLFDSVVGQAHVTTTLRNALRLDRLAHAYLFVGPRGVGKTSTARILAKAVNCEQPGADAEPCDACTTCVGIREGSAFDVIEIDAASNNSVEDIRELRDRVRFPPAAARRKVYIIDEVHMLSAAAFNAFLKTLEEPPDHCLFVMATTEVHRIPATILSRCQRFDFRRITTRDIAERLGQICADPEAGVPHEAPLLLEIARAGDGSMRDAESLLDQIIACGDQAVTAAATELVLGSVSFEWLHTTADAMRAGDAAALLRLIADVAEAGNDLHQVVRDLAGYARNLMVAGETDGTALVDLGEDDAARVLAHARECPPGFALKMLDALVDLDGRFRFAASGRVALELTALKLARWGGAVDATDVIEQITALEAKLGGDGAPPPTADARGGTGAPAASGKPRNRAAPRSGGSGSATASAVADAVPQPPDSGSPWGRFMSVVKETKRPAFYHAQHARLGAVDERTVQIVLPETEIYNKDYLTSAPILPVLEQAAAQVWGGPRRLLVVLETELAAGAPVADGDTPEPEVAAAPEPAGDVAADASAGRARDLAREDAVRQDPIVQHVLERFEGRITNIGG